MTDCGAAARGWGKGYPTDRLADMVKVTTTQPLGDVSVWVHKAIAPLVQHCMSAAPDHGYSLHPGWCWGYANRAIRGSRKPSNHSWGLAVDLNAPANPMTDHLVTDIPPGYVGLWKSFGFAWGGDYQGRVDAMHFEYMGTPQDAAKAVASLLPLIPTQQTVKVKPMFDPPIAVVDMIAWPHGGVVAVGPDGAVYTAGGAPYLGGANVGPADFPGTGRKAARIAYRAAVAGSYGEGYTITDTAGERYDYSGLPGQ